jgi:glycosyltransferase involved in cell wall biosynthesis
MVSPGYPLLVNLAVLSPKPTGISVYACQVVPHLQPLNPLLLSAQPWPGFAHHPISSHMTPLQGIKGHGRRLLWTEFQLARLYGRYRSRLIFSPVPEIPLGWGCRSVAMIHDLIPLRFPQRRSALTGYFRHVLPWVIRQAEHLVCNSQATAEEVMAYFRVPARKITPIPLAYDASQFYPRPENDRRGHYFLYVGRPDPHKNLERVIRAFALGPEDTELWIVGGHDRRYTPALQALGEHLQVGERLRFLDYVPQEDLPRLYGQALALVFPSLWEGFGLPVLESMACGTPVITSQVSALPEAAGSAALLVNPYGVEEIAEAMATIAQGGSFVQQLREAGLAQAQKFSWQATGQATAQVLQRFL